MNTPEETATAYAIAGAVMDAIHALFQRHGRYVLMDHVDAELSPDGRLLHLTVRDTFGPDIEREVRIEGDVDVMAIVPLIKEAMAGVDFTANDAARRIN